MNAFRYLKRGIALLSICFSATLLHAQVGDTTAFYTKKIGWISFRQRLSEPTVRHQIGDSAIYYFKETGERPVLVTSLEHADFFRVIPPFTFRDSSVEIKDFYKNGKLRFIGNAEPSNIKLDRGYIAFDGPCMSFYPNGKRKIITTYKQGIKQGYEYYYYPDGSTYQVLKYKVELRGLVSIPLLETFFDRTGKEICSNGNGMAYEYDSNFNIKRTGTIKKGKKNGAWRGYLTGKDSSKYILNYVDDEYVSGTGYDTLNIAHPFKIISVDAKPPGGHFYFLNKFKRLLRNAYAAKDLDKILDSTAVCFTITEDGSLTNFKSLSSVPEELNLAMKNALAKCDKWKPAFVYGITLKTIVCLDLGVKVEHDSRGDKSEENLSLELHYYNGHQIISD